MVSISTGRSDGYALQTPDSSSQRLSCMVCGTRHGERKGKQNRFRVGLKQGTKAVWDATSSREGDDSRHANRKERSAREGLEFKELERDRVEALVHGQWELFVEESRQFLHRGKREV